MITCCYIQQYIYQPSYSRVCLLTDFQFHHLNIQYIRDEVHSVLPFLTQFFFFKFLALEHSSLCIAKLVQFYPNHVWITTYHNTLHILSLLFKRNNCTTKPILPFNNSIYLIQSALWP